MCTTAVNQISVLKRDEFSISTRDFNSDSGSRSRFRTLSQMVDGLLKWWGTKMSNGIARSSIDLSNLYFRNIPSQLVWQQEACKCHNLPAPTPARGHICFRKIRHFKGSCELEGTLRGRDCSRVWPLGKRIAYIIILYPLIEMFDLTIEKSPVASLYILAK